MGFLLLVCDADMSSKEMEFITILQITVC
jgi:hypothetical protein